MAISIEQFARALTDSGLLPAAEVDAVRETVPAGDTEAFARELVKRQKLTKFQAQQVYAGKGKALVLGNYLILDKLGQGGMGMVLKARHRRMQRTVALKILSPAITRSADAVARFRREVEAAGSPGGAGAGFPADGRQAAGRPLPVHGQGSGGAADRERPLRRRWSKLLPDRPRWIPPCRNCSTPSRRPKVTQSSNVHHTITGDGKDAVRRLALDQFRIREAGPGREDENVSAQQETGQPEIVAGPLQMDLRMQMSRQNGAIPRFGVMPQLERTAGVRFIHTFQVPVLRGVAGTDIVIAAYKQHGDVRVLSAPGSNLSEGYFAAPASCMDQIAQKDQAPGFGLQEEAGQTLKFGGGTVRDRNRGGTKGGFLAEMGVGDQQRVAGGPPDRMLGEKPQLFGGPVEGEVSEIGSHARTVRCDNGRIKLADSRKRGRLADSGSGGRVTGQLPVRGTSVYGRHDLQVVRR